MFRRMVLVAGIVTAMGAAQQPTFRSSVELVTIDVVATRADGAPVPDLTAGDFELLEDGVPQKIQTFQFVDLSEKSALVHPLPSGIASNEIEPGGLFTVVLDEIGVQVDDVQAVRRIAARFFREALLPNDYVAVVRSGADSGFFLTSDRTLALDAVAQSTGRRERTLGVQAPGGAEPEVQESPATVETFGTGENGRPSFRVLLGVVERLRHIPARRKAILWFSRGGQLPPNYIESLELGRAVGRDDEVFTQLINTAREANVAIYTVDPRGLQAPGSEVGRDLDPFETGSLRDLAAATGGRAVLNNDPNGALERIAAENRAYYLMGYAPSPTGARPRARKLSVKTRVPGVSLLHRKVYLPSAAKPTAISVLESPLPVRDLAIALAPAAVAGDRNRRGIIVPFEIGATLADGTNVDYTVVALDPAGRAIGRATGVVKMAGGQAQGEARIEVKPQTYQVRVAARAGGAAGTTEGSAFATVQVPAGQSKPAQCSGFVFEQPGTRASLRQFTRDAPITISTLISADKLNAGAIAFGLGADGGPVQRTWPVELGQPLAKGLWRVSLSLKPRLPGGQLEIKVLENDFVLGEGCTTAFVLR
jgi:VWFA-related protein